MPHLRFYTLGPFQALLDGQALRGFASDKERALLAYLALSPSDRPISRLRNALYNLRKLLAPLDLLHSTRQTVQLDSAHPHVWCDALALEQVASDAAASMQQVQDALSLVHGDLLQGIELRDCPAFIVWLEQRRQQLAAQVKLLEEKLERLTAALAAPKGFLPRALTPFFGREQELALLARKAVDPTCGLITIVGEGGIGKTRLALALAEQVRPAFPGGVWFVPLANLSPDDEALAAADQPATLVERLAAAIAARLSIQLRPGIPSVDQVVQRLAGPRLLLILDNFEHLEGAEPLLVDLLQAAPNLCLLVTSRRRLDLQAETVFRLGGLATPPITAGAGQPATLLADLQHYSSIQLFVERAERRRGGFALDETNRAAVVQICQLVEGLPLGIELAAALTDQHSCAEIASAMAATVDTLASTMADLAPRHRSLRAVFEYSWRLLSAPEQAALARCAIFRGGFTAEAAAAVAGASPEVLASLADKSLLRPVSEARYDMHELLRYLAAEKLLDEPEARAAMVERHCAFYARFLYAQGTTMADDPALLRRAWEETDNLEAAFRTAVRQRHCATLRQMVHNMTVLWHSRGWFRRATALLTEAASALRLELAFTADEAEAQAALGRILRGLSYFTEQLGRLPEAVAWAEEAARIGQLLGDGELEALAWQRVAAIRWSRSELLVAEQAARRSLELANQVGDAGLRAMTMAGLSLVLRERGQWEAAAALDEESLAQAQDAGRRRLRGVILGNLGESFTASGDFRRARDRLEQALVIRRETEDRLGVGIVLKYFALLSLALGDPADAQRKLGEALAIFEATEQAAYHAVALLLRARAHMAQQAGNSAFQDARQALDLATGAAIRPLMAQGHLALAEIWQAQGQVESALDECQAALELARETSDDKIAPAALAIQARPLAAQGDWSAVRKILQQILPLPEQVSFHPLSGNVEAYLVASQALAADDPVQAQSLLQHVHQRLLAAADTIEDPAARHTFLHDNPSHRQVLALMAGGS